LGLIGVEEGKIEERKLVGLLKNLGFKPGRQIRIKVKTSRGWIAFQVYEVTGFTEGVAAELAATTGCTALESGEHTILGEVSAKLWNEAFRIVFPDGKEELVVAIIHDGFLDAVMPTDSVEGLNGTVYIGGVTFKTPLSQKDLLLIATIGKAALDKLEKLVNAYGKNKVLSKEALEYIESLSKKEVKESVDYEAGFVIIIEGSKVKAIPLPEYVLLCLRKGRKEKAIELVRGAPDDQKKEILVFLEERAEIYKALGEKKEYDVVEDFLKEIREYAEENSKES